MEQSVEQCTMSYELLKFIEWLVNHEQESMRQLMLRALQQGLAHTLKQQEQPSAETVQTALQEHVVDFFTVMDALLHQVIYDYSEQASLHAGMVPASRRIDPHTCDVQAIHASIAKALTATRQGKSGKDALCKEFMRRWKPYKNSQIN